MQVVGDGGLVRRDRYANGSLKERSRCRKWELSVRVVDKGVKSTRTRAFEGTYSEARSACDEFVAELKGTEPSSDITLAEWCAIWNERREASGAYSARTLRTDLEKLPCVLMHLGDMKVSEIRVDDIRRLYASAMAGETPTGKQWAPATVARMHTTLSKLFGDAVDEGLVSVSPTLKAKPPKPKKGSGKAMPQDEMDELLDSLDYSIDGDRAVALALGCGLRRSEACALLWPDLTDGCVIVSKSLDYDGSVKQTKTGKSRSVPVPENVWRGLDSHRSTGRVVNLIPQALTHWWTRHRGAFGCEGYRFHDLRHSYATRLAANGVHMRVAMELCGWSSVETAMKVYTHVSNEMQRDAVRMAFDSSDSRDSRRAYDS